jgi:hypothetical protein
VSLRRSQSLRDLGATQAVATELTGYAGKFRCFLERRVLIAKNSSTQECCDADLGGSPLVLHEFISFDFFYFRSG